MLPFCLMAYNYGLITPELTGVSITDGRGSGESALLAALIDIVIMALMPAAR